MPLFEVAVLKKPTPKEIEEGATEELVLGPKAVVAQDAQSAAISAALGSKLDVDIQKCSVLVRPFA